MSTMNTWAIVEIFGHQKFAGYLTECEMGGGKLMRLDVPACAGHPAFTKYFGVAAIYSITPVEEDVAHAVAIGYRQAPVSAYDFGEEVRNAIRAARAKSLPSVVVDTYEVHDDEDEDDAGDDTSGDDLNVCF